MGEEYEIISHEGGSYHMFVVNMLYRTPHIHLDFEFVLVLSGTMDVIVSDGKVTLKEGDLCLINPLESHEFHAPSPALLLLLQVPPAFLSSLCPEADHLAFTTRSFRDDSLKEILLDLALEHFQNRQWGELYAMGQVCLFLNGLLHHAEYVIEGERSWKRTIERSDRLRRILDLIGRRYTGRITLQDLADELGVSTYYLSHYFKDAMGISFQDYVTRFRCEQARRLLLTTDESALTVSLMCGFSDVKYLTRGFRKQYGMTPGEYRRAFRHEKMREQQRSMLSTQEFMSDEASLVILDQYIEKNGHSGSQECG